MGRNKAYPNLGMACTCGIHLANELGHRESYVVFAPADCARFLHPLCSSPAPAAVMFVGHLADSEEVFAAGSWPERIVLAACGPVLLTVPVTCACGVCAASLGATFANVTGFSIGIGLVR